MTLDLQDEWTPLSCPPPDKLLLLKLFSGDVVDAVYVPGCFGSEKEQLLVTWNTGGGETYKLNSTEVVGWRLKNKF